jgi:undecaprenyl-diphosphatase
MGHPAPAVVSAFDPKAQARRPDQEWPAGGQPILGHTAATGRVGAAGGPGSAGPVAEPAHDEMVDVGRIPPSIRRWIAAVDTAVDDYFEPYRGRAAPDVAAKIVANVSDHGLVWALEAAWRVRRPGPGRRKIVRDLAVAGIGSSITNAAVKSLVGRARPDRTKLELRAGNVPVREPTSSSFPSGHTLAAFCTATVMADPKRPVASTARFALAGLVGLSRVHLRAHHASDVVGGMAIGLAVGALGRQVLR